MLGALVKKLFKRLKGRAAHGTVNHVLARRLCKGKEFHSNAKTGGGKSHGTTREWEVRCHPSGFGHTRAPATDCARCTWHCWEDAEFPEGASHSVTSQGRAA